ncbi:hypothetical protein HWV62_18551 [Athelia sp. TMB]|nr:hypothetical protein HWV62_18551 [Athelia sp. TMB]
MASSSQRKGKAHTIDKNLTPHSPRVSAHPYTNTQSPPAPSTEEQLSWAAHIIAELSAHLAAPTIAEFYTAYTMAEPQPAPAAVPLIDMAQLELCPVFDQQLSSAMHVESGNFSAGPSSSTATVDVPFYQHQGTFPWEFMPSAFSDTALAGSEYGLSNFLSPAEVCAVALNPHIQDNFSALHNYNYKQQLA